MTEEAKTRKHAKAIRAEKKSGQYRIIAVKRIVTATTETKTVARIE